MAELKTQRHDGSVEAFLDGVENERRRKDARRVMEMMERVTGDKPAMWGPSIVGFGSYHYKYKSGREGEWFLTGFSPRKQALTLYLMGGHGRHENLMDRLGKFKTGKGCVYINKLEDVDFEVLTQLVRDSVEHLRHVSS